MSFLRPEALWLVPVVVGILLWVRHRARRRPRPVTSWLLFERARAALPPAATRRHPILRDLLLVSPPLLVALALARPVFSDSAPAGVSADSKVEANVGIVTCGADERGALLIRVVGAGRLQPVVLSITGRDPQTILPDALPWTSVVEGVADAKTEQVEVRVRMAGDGRAADDVVTLSRERDRVAIGFPASGHDALHRAFSAHPGASVFRGPGPCDLRVGEGEGRVRLRVAPDGAREPRPISGTLRVQGAPLTADLSLESVHVPVDGGGATLAQIDGQPLVVGLAAQLLLLQDPERSAWPDHPTFPLLCAELLRWAEAPTGFVADAPIPMEEDVLRLDQPQPEVAAVLDGRTPLAPLLYGAAAFLFAGLILTRRI